MPLIEVDDPTLAALAANGIKHTDASSRWKQASDSQAAINDILNGPNRAAFLKLYKAQYPNSAVPEIDAAAPVLSEVAELRKMIADDKAEREKKEEERATKAREDSANDSVAKGRSWLRREKKLDDDGVKAIEDIMREEGIPNYHVAFNHWRAEHPAETATDLPSSYAGRSLDWFKAEADQPDHQLLLKDPIGFRNKEIRKFFQEKAEGKLNLPAA